MNELLEQGVTRCGELTDAADEALRAVDDMTKEAAALHESVVEGAEVFADHLREFRERLQDHEETLEGAFVPARQALGLLADKGAWAVTRAGEALAQARADLADLATRDDALDAALETGVAAAEGDLRALGGRSAAAQARAEEGIRRASLAIGTLRGALEAARTGFAKQYESWQEDVEDFADALMEHRDGCTTAFETLLGRQSRALQALAAAMTASYDESVADVVRRFTVEAPQAFATALDDAETSLTSLGAAAADAEQRVKEGAGALAQRAGTARPVCVAIAAALATADGLA